MVTRAEVRKSRGAGVAACADSLPAMRILLLLLLTVGATFAADLTFAEETITLTPKPGAQSATANYSFTNTGSTALTITGLLPSCGCATIALDKRSYDPAKKVKSLRCWISTALAERCIKPFAFLAIVDQKLPST